MFQELPKIGSNMHTAETRRSRDFERAAGALMARRNEGLGLLHCRQDLNHPLIKAAACLGELKLARGPMKQPCAEPCFKVTDSLADNGRRKVQFAPSSGHAARSDHPCKNLQICNRSHKPLLTMRKLYAIQGARYANLL